MNDNKEDKPEDRYRDDPDQFAASADSVQRGSNVISGGGVESPAEPVTSMSRGSQEDWRPDSDASVKPVEKQAANDDEHAKSGGDSGGGDSGGGDSGGDDADGGTSKVAPNNPQSPDDRER